MVALFVRNGGSRHTGQAAPPQRNIQFVEIEGIGNDENGDFDIAKAIKKIEMPDDVRIKA